MEANNLEENQWFEQDSIDERSKKQLYLKDNIVNKGYDKEEFAIFLSNFKDSNGNVDCWSYDEIVDLVSQFQKQNSPLKQDQEDKIKEEASVENDSPENKENIAISQENKVDDKMNIKPQILLDFEESIKISDKTSLCKSDETIVKITDVVENSGGLFKFSYVEYVIETQPFGWSVVRKENDFIKLRDYILKKFPQYVIPPLLPVKNLFTVHDKETKRIYFQEFLSSLTKHPELCAWKLLEEFLSIDDEEGFRDVRKLRENEPAPTSLNTYSNRSGRANLTIKWKNLKLLNQFDKFFIARYEEILKEIKESMLNIQKHSKLLSESINQFGTCFENLNDLFTQSGFDDKAKIYTDIQTIISAYETSVTEQAATFQKHLETTTSFHILEANSLREFHKHKEDVYWQSHRLEKDLMNK